MLRNSCRFLVVVQFFTHPDLWKHLYQPPRSVSDHQVHHAWARLQASQYSQEPKDEPWSRSHGKRCLFFFWGGGGDCQRENEVQIVVFLCFKLIMHIEEVHGKLQLNRWIACKLMGKWVWSVKKCQKRKTLELKDTLPKMNLASKLHLHGLSIL